MVVYERLTALESQHLYTMDNFITQVCERRRSITSFQDTNLVHETADIISSHDSYRLPYYFRQPFLIVEGKGSYVWDSSGQKYLDFTAGIVVNALGHCETNVATLIAEQANTLIHISNDFHSPWSSTLAKSIIRTTREDGGMPTASRIFLCNTGTEANSAVLKLAFRTAKSLQPRENKRKIVAFENSYHDRTCSSLSPTYNPLCRQ